MERIRLLTRKDPFLSILSPLHYQSSNLPKTLSMAASQFNSKRPTCPSCSKPSSLCLCNRIRNPGLENKVNVTILQHSLEKKHPLNSVRIAKLGLKNVKVATVSDVNFGARFVIRLPKSTSGLNGRNRFDFDGVSDRNGFSSGKENVDEQCLKHSKEENSNRSNELEIAINSSVTELPSTLMDEKTDVNEEPVIFFTIGKNGVVTDLDSKWELQPRTHAQKGPNFDQILASQVAIEALSRGFVVKKLQKQQKNGSINLEEYEEFEVGVPSGSILLFPSETAVSVDELQRMNIEVRSLIVLDGTWAKAKRIYKENPWLKLLPHLKLDLSKLSLYNEIRHQPHAGCLSTIESIVYALKALGDNHEELDHLLNVFESMVEDQRHCKDERLKKSSPL
ncbi:uncharacterized protein [Euphorbia lathyris]|uniref:uncharacterized protein n=1 Tax=Euphorbia lathyris TaxID=212925 RepID=UPI0033143FB1